MKGTEHTYLFVVDAQTGSQLSKAIKFTHGDSGGLYNMFVQSHGMVMKDGNVFLTFFPTTNGANLGWSVSGWGCGLSSKTTRIRLGGYNSNNNSVIFYSESAEYGRASAMIDTKMSTGPIWFGGTVSILTGTNPEWYFALYQLNTTNGKVANQFRFRDKTAALFNDKANEQGYIKHMAYDASTLMFFGSWETVNFSLPGAL